MSCLRTDVTDAWMVDYMAALATICFMLFLGAQSSCTTARMVLY